MLAIACGYENGDDLDVLRTDPALKVVLSQTLPTDSRRLGCWRGFQRASAMIEFKGSHFERGVILWAVRWYVAYPISYRQPG